MYTTATTFVKDTWTIAVSGKQPQSPSLFSEKDIVVDSGGDLDLLPPPKRVERTYEYYYANNCSNNTDVL